MQPGLDGLNLSLCQAQQQVRALHEQLLALQGQRHRVRAACLALQQENARLATPAASAPLGLEDTAREASALLHPRARSMPLRGLSGGALVGLTRGKLKPELELELRRR